MHTYILKFGIELYGQACETQIKKRKKVQIQQNGSFKNTLQQRF